MDNNDFPIQIKAVKKYLVHCPRCQGEWRSDSMGMTECPKCPSRLIHTPTSQEPDLATFRHQRLNSPVGREISEKLAQSTNWPYFDLKPDGHLYDEQDEIAFPRNTFADHNEAETFLTANDIRGTIRTAITPTDICQECGQHRPGDDRVKAGMKCGFCAYAAIDDEFVKLATADEYPMGLPMDLRNVCTCGDKIGNSCSCGRKPTATKTNSSVEVWNQDNPSFQNLTVCPKCQYQWSTEEKGIVVCPKCKQWLNRTATDVRFVKLAEAGFPLQTIEDLRKWQQLSFDDLMRQLPTAEADLSQKFGFGPTVKMLADIASGQTTLTRQVQHNTIGRALLNNIISYELAMRLGDLSKESVPTNINVGNPAGSTRAVTGTVAAGQFPIKTAQLPPDNNPNYPCDPYVDVEIKGETRVDKDGIRHRVTTPGFGRTPKAIFTVDLGTGVVTLYDNGRTSCQCRDWGKNHACQHTQEVEKDPFVRKLQMSDSAAVEKIIMASLGVSRLLPVLMVEARTKLGDRNIHWREMYTRDTAYFKQMYEDLVGKGCYFRFEGRDADSGDEYFAIIGPGHMHDPEPQFFAGTRKLPSDYSAGGLYFSNIREAMMYAEDTWGLPIPQDANYGWTSRNLRGLSVNKMDNWRDTHTKDSVMKNFQGPIREGTEDKIEDVAQDFPVRLVKADPTSTSTSMPMFAITDRRQSLTKEAMPMARLYKSREQGYLLFDPVKVAAHQDPRWEEACAESPSLRTALTIAERDLANRKYFYRWDYEAGFADKTPEERRSTPMPPEIERLFLYYIAYSDVEGIYLISIGPYNGDYFGQAIHKYYAGTRKLNIVTNDEIQSTLARAINNYVEQYAERDEQGNIDPDSVGLRAEDFNILVPDADGLVDDNSLTLNPSGQQKIKSAMARKMGVAPQPTAAARTAAIEKGIDVNQSGWEDLAEAQGIEVYPADWEDSAAAALEAQQRAWLDQHRQWLPATATIQSFDRDQLDKAVKSIWLKYRYDQKKVGKGEAPSRVWDKAQMPPPPQLKNNIEWREGAQGFRQVYREPKYTVANPPANGTPTLRVRQERGESDLKAGYRIKFIYQMPDSVKGGRPISGRRLLGDKMYLIESAQSDAEGFINLTLAEPYANPAGTPAVTAWESSKVPTAIAVQANTVQQVSIPGSNGQRQTVVVDWEMPAIEIARQLRISPQRAKELKKANTIANFGCDSLDEAVQFFKETGLPIDSEDAPKLATTHNVTSQELDELGKVANANRKTEIERPRYADHEKQPETDATKKKQPDQVRKTRFNRTYTPKRQGEPAFIQTPTARPIGKPTSPTETTAPTVPSRPQVKETVPTPAPTPAPVTISEPETQFTPAPADPDWPTVRRNRQALGVINTFKSLLQLAKNLEGQNRSDEAAEVRGILAKHSTSRFATSAFADYQVVEIPAERVVKGDFIEHKSEGFFRVDDIVPPAQSEQWDETHPANPAVIFYFSGNGGKLQIMARPQQLVKVMRRKGQPLGQTTTAAGEFPIRVAQTQSREQIHADALLKALQEASGPRTVEWVCKRMLWPINYVRELLVLLFNQKRIQTTDGYGQHQPVEFHSQTEIQTTENPVELVKKDCGIHAGLNGGPCSKCKHQEALMANPKYRAGLQYGGTPWTAVVGEQGPIKSAQSNQVLKCDRPKCQGTFGPMDRHCGARICNVCGNHTGLERCYCGWSLTSPGRGREELEEAGETIDSD